MGRKQSSSKSKPSSSPTSAGKKSSNLITRSFGAYFPRSSAQVQPETASIVPSLEAEILSKTRRIDELLNRVTELSAENEKRLVEREGMKAGFEADLKVKDDRIASLMKEIEEVKKLSNSQRFVGFNNNKDLSFRKTGNVINKLNTTTVSATDSVKLEEPVRSSNTATPSPSPSVRCQGPRIPKPPPKRCVSEPSSSSSSLSGPPPPPPPPPPPGFKSKARGPPPPPPPPPPPGFKSKAKGPPPPPPPPPPPGFKSKAKGPPPPPPPPPPPGFKSKAKGPPPPPPPPPPRSGVKIATNKVKRVPEVIEFYNSLMRHSKKDSSLGTADTTSSSTAKDLVGEIENRSAYLLAIKTDVETQKEFISFLIKEVETAAFTNIEDVVSFVKWLDDELSYLVDERAVLKHFDWPEQKADALREAAFEYSDFKKIESEASSFTHDARQPCSTTLKKMQTLLEKLERGVYNLSRLRESATNRFKSFHMPVDWMLDTGFVSQMKLASVKLAMKYMKRVSAELERVGSGPEEELIVQGVRFAFHVHQFAGGFNAETMTAFEELRDKATSYHVQCQNQQQRFACPSMPC